VAELEKSSEEIKPSVGLIIVTKGPQKSPIMAILRRRGDTKYNGKIWVQEPWAGLCQATVHGKIKWEESPTHTLYRKAKDQLGECFFNSVKLDDREARLLINDNERRVKTYGLCVHPKCISHIRLDSSSAGIKRVYLDKLDEIRIATKADRNTPITDLNDIVMFEDEFMALQEIMKDENRQLLSIMRHW
jgi:hypothetical protein